MSFREAKARGQTEKGEPVRTYIFRRILLFLPVLFMVTLLTFFSQRFLPGDATLNLVQDVNRTTPAELEKLKKDLGLDKSPWSIKQRRSISRDSRTTGRLETRGLEVAWIEKK